MQAVWPWAMQTGADGGAADGTGEADASTAKASHGSHGSRGSRGSRGSHRSHRSHTMVDMGEARSPLSQAATGARNAPTVLELQHPASSFQHPAPADRPWPRTRHEAAGRAGCPMQAGSPSPVAEGCRCCRGLQMLQRVAEIWHRHHQVDEVREPPSGRSRASPAPLPSHRRRSPRCQPSDRSNQHHASPITHHASRSPGPVTALQVLAPRPLPLHRHGPPVSPPAKMPRDLIADRKTLQSMPRLSREAAASSPPPDEPMPFYRVPTTLIEDRFKRMKDLRPFPLLLNQADLDDCDWLEHAAFDPHEAASREKIEYRLRTCGELCSGIFASAYPTSPGPLGVLIKARRFPAVDSADSDRKRLLLGHIIATKHTSPLVTDAAMDFPSDWRTKHQLTPSTGHNEDGETVCLHSLCVHPDFHAKGIGAVLLRGWTQRIKDSGVGKRIALICREHLVGWYEKAGFEKVGPSKCQYGGGGWIDMVMEFEKTDMDDDDF